MQIFAQSPRRLLVAAITGSLLAAGLPAATVAQNLYEPAVRVNDRAITNYEVTQRVLLLSELRTPGDLDEIAVEKLIDERLQLDAAERAGIVIPDEAVTRGIDEFAARGSLSGEQLLATLNQAGIASESLRDFVYSGLAWREFVQSNFGPKSNVTKAEIDRAIDRAFEQPEGLSSARVLMSEIFLAANTPEAKAESEVLAVQIADIKSFEGFAAAAREYSVGPSGRRGGRVETWVSLTDLPSAIASTFLTMKPGETAGPFPITNALVIFQLRAFEEVPEKAPAKVSVDYAMYFPPVGRAGSALAAAQHVQEQVDTCDDLFGIAKGQPEEWLRRETLPISEIPRDVALELAKLDVNESSTSLQRPDGQGQMLLMLCSRKSDTEVDLSPEAVGNRLRTARLVSYADAYLAELRADAIIVFP